MAAKIKMIKVEDVLGISKTMEPKGLFMTELKDGWYLGINTLGEEVSSEGFKTREECEKWLREGR